MSLPSTCPFTGTDTTAIIGNTTDFFGGTGTNTWVNMLTGTCVPQILTNSAYGGGSGTARIIGYDAGTPNIVLSYKIVSVGSFSNVVVRSNAAATTYIALWPDSGRIRVFDEALTLIGTFTGTVANNDVISIQFNANVFTVSLNGTACTGLTNVTSSHGSSNQYVGLFFETGSARMDDFNVSVFVVTTPTAVVTIPAPAGNTFFGTSGTSGTGPYTYQWQRSTSPTSGFSNLSNGSGITGATTLTMVDGSATALAANTPATALYYRLVVTDSLSATFNSNVLASVPGTHPIKSLWLWDSIGAGSGTVGPGPDYVVYAPSFYGARQVALTNLSIGGAQTNHWYNSNGDGESGTAQGGTSTSITLRSGASAVDGFYTGCRVTTTGGTGSGQVRYGSTVTPYVGATRVLVVSSAWSVTPDSTTTYTLSGITLQLVTDVATGVSASCTMGEIRLGINDSSTGKTSTYYGNNLSGMAAYMIAQGFTLVVLHYPTGVEVAADMSGMIAYLPVIDGLANGTTILRGDTKSFVYFSEFGVTYLNASDGIHQVDAGLPALAIMTLIGTATAIGDVGVYTAAANVRNGTDRGDGVTGTLVVPTRANVLNGVSTDNTTGTYVTVATGDVRLSTTFGAASALTGTLAVPSAANVLNGVSVDNTTGTYVTVATTDVHTGVTYGAGSALTGTYDGSDRWTDPGVSHVQNGTTYKANSTTNNRTGSYDPITGNYTDPGIGVVQVGATYKFAGSTLTGTYDPITGQYTDPGVARVQLGATYTFAGSLLTGTYTGGGGGGTYTDPGTGNVKIGTNYTFNNVVQVGTYDGSDRWSDPGIAHVENTTSYKANSTSNNRTGTLENPSDATIAAAIWTYLNRTLTG